MSAWSFAEGACPRCGSHGHHGCADPGCAGAERWPGLNGSDDDLGEPYDEDDA